MNSRLKVFASGSMERHSLLSKVEGSLYEFKLVLLLALFVLRQVHEDHKR